MIVYLKDGTLPIYYESGKKKGEITYKNGKPDGKFTYWYENGQLRLESYYKEGKKDGLLGMKMVSYGINAISKMINEFTIG